MANEFPIRTDIARHYFWRQVITAVACLVLAVWGWYDLTVSIPAQEEAYEAFTSWNTAKSELQKKVDAGQPLSQEERTVYETLETNLEQFQETPERPNTFDSHVQWMFISCILGVPWCLFAIVKIRRAVYALDEEGNLTLPGGRTWTRDSIAGINMERWMSKSIATVEHNDGSTVKLDAYLYRNLELIIGELAHRFDPEHWHTNGKPVKDDDDEHEVSAEADESEAHTESDERAA